MTVLISGAGIAGLTLGLALHRAGVPFRILEAVAAIRPLGVGINLQPHAVRELRRLGLGAELDAVGLRTEEVAYFSAQGRPIWREPRGLLAGYRWPQYSIHRGRLQMLLLDALRARAGDVVRTGAAVTGWDEMENGVEARLTDRRSRRMRGVERGAVLIAADGIDSAVRAALNPGEGPARWGGTVMWRGVTDGPRFLTGRTVAMAGTKDTKFVAYPIADTPGGSLVNWIADRRLPAGHGPTRPDWKREGDLADFLPAFEDWRFDWLDVPAVIRGAEAVYEYPMVDRDPLDRWTRGRVTLMGDAAHAMYPIGSNGASQGVVDAAVLAREIERHGMAPAALHAYEDARREAVNALVLANRGDGPDRILDVVAERAPHGFDDVEEVMPEAERRAFADRYKRLAGMEVDRANARPTAAGA